MLNTFTIPRTVGGREKGKPPQFCITIVLDFSCKDCNTKEKLKMFVLFLFLFLFCLGGGGGGGGRQGALWSM